MFKIFWEISTFLVELLHKQFALIQETTTVEKSKTLFLFLSGKNHFKLN